MSIHGTANFLSWHRFYLLAYEDTLRNECGYRGYQPYVKLGRLLHDQMEAYKSLLGTTTGRGGRKIRRIHHYSTEVRRVFLATDLTCQAVTQAVFLTTSDAQDDFLQPMAAVA